MNRTLKFCLAGVGALLLLFLHVYSLSSVPGLHYDEAWAMNFAWRLVSEPGFWTLSAMSPYTAPWTHYWAALWMKTFGPSLLVFRGSQAALSVGGLAALAFALPARFRPAFPWAVLLMPGLVLNHRFAVELTGFHAFAFGLLCLGLRRRWHGLALVAALAGTTAHILFYGIVLGLVGMIFLEGITLDRRARAHLMFYFSFMALFFVNVFFAIPEKGKAAGLVLSSVSGLGLLACGSASWPIWRIGKKLLPVAAAVFLFNGIFFAQGSWNEAIQTSSWMWEKTFWFLAGLFFWSGIAWASLRGILRAPSWSRTWLLAAFFLVGLMMLKPAPRYFELLLLGLALIWSGDWTTTRWTPKWFLVCAAVLVNAAAVYSSYFSVASATTERPLHFLLFKDSSRDFLDKQSLVRFLGSSGCALSDIHSSDPRLMEALKALSLGDWPVDTSEPCAWNFVTRRSDANGIGEPFEDFMLRSKE